MWNIIGGGHCHESKYIETDFTPNEYFVNVANTEWGTCLYKQYRQFKFIQWVLNFYFDL